MKKEDVKDFGTIIFALLVGYVIIAFFGFLTYSGAPITGEVSITGFAVTNQVSEQDASLALGKSKQIIEDAEKLGLKTARLKDLLEEARKQMISKNYERVAIISDEIANLQQKALEIQDRIKNTTIMIGASKKFGLNVTEVEILLNLSIIEHSLENYEGAELYLSSSTEKLNIISEAEIATLIKNFSELKNYSLENNLNITRLDNTINDAKDALAKLDVKKINSLKQEFTNLNKTINILIDAQKDVNLMANVGLGTARINSVLNELEFGLELGYYNKIEYISNDIKNLRLKAFEIKDSIEKTKAKIEEARGYALDVSKPESLLNSSEYEFKLEDYEEAEKLSKESFEKTEKLIADSLLFGVISKSELRFSIINYLKRFWWAALIGLVLFSVLGIFLYQKFSIIILKSSLKALEREKNAITDLIKKDQIAYFKDNTMDKSTYDLTIDKYQNRIIQIREKIPIIKDKLSKQKEKEWRIVK